MTRARDNSHARQIAGITRARAARARATRARGQAGPRARHAREHHARERMGAIARDTYAYIRAYVCMPMGVRSGVRICAGVRGCLCVFGDVCVCVILE